MLAFAFHQKSGHLGPLWLTRFIFYTHVGAVGAVSVEVSTSLWPVDGFTQAAAKYLSTRSPFPTAVILNTPLAATDAATGTVTSQLSD